MNNKFDLGKYQISESLILTLLDDNKRFEAVNKYIYRFYYFQETENHLLVQFFYGQNIVGVYDKEKKSAEAVELTQNVNEYFL